MAFGKNYGKKDDYEPFFLGDLERERESRTEEKTERKPREEKKPRKEKKTASLPASDKQTADRERKEKRKMEKEARKIQKKAAAQRKTQEKRSAKQKGAPALPAKKNEPQEVKKEEPIAPAPAPVKKRKKPLRAVREIPGMERSEKKEEEPLPPSVPKAPEENPALSKERLDEELDGKYGVWREKQKNRKKKLGGREIFSYAFLFLLVFGFLFGAYFVGTKMWDYYLANKLNSELQQLIKEPDRFEAEYLAKSPASPQTFTLLDSLNGNTSGNFLQGGALNAEQQNLIGKISRLRSINSDTAGWITISGTVVNYPVVWSAQKSYYLHRDFYGKTLTAGTIYIDHRNSRILSENRNTVIYGHNMNDGSMFASLHDFSNPSLFQRARIEIATEDGIYVYTPFSVHPSDAYDNYFETDFKNDADFIDFCATMSFISTIQTDFEFTPESRIITLSTCMDNLNATDGRFAVHAVLTQIIR